MTNFLTYNMLVRPVNFKVPSSLLLSTAEDTRVLTHNALYSFSVSTGIIPTSPLFQMELYRFSDETDEQLRIQVALIIRTISI